MNTTLEHVILQGVLQYLGRAFGPVVSQAATENGNTNAALQPKFISTTDKWHVLKQLDGQTNTFQYPYMFLHLTGVSLPEQGESYNPKALLRAGVYGVIDDSKTTYRRHRIIPVKMSCEVSFLTNDFWQSMAFVNAWMFSVLKKDLNFNVKFDDVSYSIQVELDSTLSAPDKDNAVDIPNNYELIGNIYIKAFFSENKAIVDVERYPIFRNLVVTPVFVNPGQTLEELVETEKLTGQPAQYIEIPNDNPYLPTENEQVVIQITSIS